MTTTKTSKTAAPKAVRYLVRAGSFTTKKAASARLAALTADGVKGFTVVKHTTGATVRYWVQRSGLTKSNAAAVTKRVHHFKIKTTLLRA